MATPELPDLIDDAMETFARDRLHTSFVGQVVALYPNEKYQFVDVQPSVATLLPVDDDRDDAATTDPLVEEALPVVMHAPVGYTQGGGWFVSVPLAVGDFVLVVCCQRSIDRWIEVARKDQRGTVGPADVGTHTLEGAVVLPVGPAPRAHLLEGVEGAALVIAHVSGTPSLKMTDDGAVRITGDLVVSGEVTAGAGTPGHAVTLTKHKHLTAMGPSGAPLPEAP